MEALENRTEDRIAGFLGPILQALAFCDKKMTIYRNFSFNEVLVIS